jgi:hypothetical protein
MQWVKCLSFSSLEDEQTAFPPIAVFIPSRWRQGTTKLLSLPYGESIDYVEHRNKLSNIRLYRYVRLIGNCVSAWTFKSIPPPDNPTYTPGDVTYVILTICREDQHGNLERCLRSCLATKPYRIIILTIESNLLRIANLAQSINPRMQVIAASFANKR